MPILSLAVSRPVAVRLTFDLLPSPHMPYPAPVRCEMDVRGAFRPLL